MQCLSRQNLQKQDSLRLGEGCKEDGVGEDNGVSALRGPGATKWALPIGHHKKRKQTGAHRWLNDGPNPKHSY